MEPGKNSLDSSRPSSPAQSDATEVPDISRAPRTLANDVEHIKSLIARTDSIARAPDTSITAQVFRSRSGSTGSAGPISQQRVFHELDLLKKRIRNEQQHVRRPSQIDPETESESEDIDEREEELENIRDRLLHERQQSEDLLANAESRIDGLIGEREDLARQLDARDNDFGRIHRELEAVKEEHSRHLTVEQRDKESLRNRQQVTGAEAQLAEMDIQAHLTDLQQKVNQLSTELEGKNAELAEATEHAYRMYDERDKAHEEALRELHESHAAECERQVAAANARWADETARLEVEHQRALADLEQGWSSKAEEAARSREAELSSLQNEFQTKFAGIRADSARRSAHVDNGKGPVDGSIAPDLGAQLQSARRDFEAVKQKLVDAQQQNWNQLIRFQEKHDRAIASHAAEKAVLERGHSSAVEDLQTQNSELRRQVTELKALHEHYSRPTRVSNGDSSEHLSKALGNLEECTRQLQKVHAAEVEGMQSTHNASMRALEDSSTAELRNVRQALEEAIEFAKAEGIVALDLAYRDHEETKRNLEAKISAAEEAAQSRLDDRDAQHQKTLQERELSKTEDLEALRQEHERAVRTILRSHKSELSSVEETHQQQLVDLEESLRAQQTSANAFHSKEAMERHQKALERVIGEAHETSQAEIEALRKNHRRDMSRMRAEAEKELTAALTDADEDMEERLQAQSKAHRQELDNLNENLNVELTHLHLQLEEASQIREEKLQELESQHRSVLEELHQRIEAAESTRTGLQARLDAEAMGRVDAERSLATLKREMYSEAPTESRANLRRSIVVLEAERDSLARQLAGSPTSNYSEATEGARDVPNPEYDTDDADFLKQRLVTAERERAEAQSSAERKIDEMTRQTDFLVKELELAMAQRSAAQLSHGENADAAVQTEPVAVVDAGTLLEPKADATMSQVAKQQRPDMRRSITDVDEISGKRSSFEDYVLQAQAELSDFGSVTNDSEALFAEKTKEHAAKLQSAKDQLSTEYQRRFRLLQNEKERMERAVSAKSATDFTGEHVNLFANYGIDHEDPSKQAAMFHNLHARKKKAIRKAEQDLVAEYHRRLTKRKAQIAMKHAEKFHALTRDFHRKAADLVGGDVRRPDVVIADCAEEKRGRERRGNAVPARNTIDQSQLENALRAAANTVPSSPRSQLPTRIALSTPRTTTSIPRAVPFSGRAIPVVSTSSAKQYKFESEGVYASPPLDMESNSFSPSLTTTSNDRGAWEESPVTSPADSSASRPKSRPRLSHSSRMIFAAQHA